MMIKQKKLTIFLTILLIASVFTQKGIEGLSFEEGEEPSQTPLVYDDDFILRVGMHNILSLYHMAQARGDALLVFLIYAQWCGHSQHFLPEFESLARNMHKKGSKDIYFIKIEGDKEMQLSDAFGTTGFPSIYIQEYTNNNSFITIYHRVVNGQVKDKEDYFGERSARDLGIYIRKLRPNAPENITDTERFENLRKQLSHHFVLGVFNSETCPFVKDSFMRLHEQNEDNYKFAYVEDKNILPENIRNQVKSKEILVVKNPILEDYFLLSEIELSENFEQTNENLQKAMKTPIDVLDLNNIQLYAKFEKPIVAIATTHPSITNIGSNQPFYKVLVKFLYEGGYKNHPFYDYVILNAIDIRDVQYELQLNENDGRQFYLILLQDTDTGYRYDDIIIREDEEQALVNTVQTIDQFLIDYKANKLRPYLKTEVKEYAPVYRDGILQVYGSNFYDLVKKKKQEKPMFLMFTKMNCPLCDKLEVYFERQKDEFPEFQFARMDIEKNFPTSEYRDIILSHEMPEFLMIYGDKQFEQFNRVHDTYQEMREFLEQQKTKNQNLKITDEL